MENKLSYVFRCQFTGFDLCLSLLLISALVLLTSILQHQIALRRLLHEIMFNLDIGKQLMELRYYYRNSFISFNL